MFIWSAGRQIGQRWFKRRPSSLSSLPPLAPVHRECHVGQAWVGTTAAHRRLPRHRCTTPGFVEHEHVKPPRRAQSPPPTTITAHLIRYRPGPTSPTMSSTAQRRLAVSHPPPSPSLLLTFKGHPHCRFPPHHNHHCTPPPSTCHVTAQRQPRPLPTG